MPGYVKIPYVRPAYQPGDNLGQLLQMRGQQQAQAALRQGETSAQLWGNLGTTIANTVQGVVKARDEQKEKDTLTKQDAAFMTLLQQEPNPDPRKVIAIYGPERGVKIAQGLAAFHTTPDPADVGQKSQVLRDRMLGLQALNPTLRATVYPGVREKSIADGLIKPEDAPEQYDEAWWTQAVNYGKEPTTPPKTPTRQVEVKNPDGSTSIRIVEDTPGQTFESAATPEKVTYGQPVKALVNGREAFVRAGSDGKTYGMDGTVLPPNGVRPVPERDTTASEPLVAIMKDGHPILVPRSQAVNQTPANTREQGRAVTSGDAKVMADLDTSLSLLNQLTGQIGETGFGAGVGAALPNVVTQFTGWGESAKQRQAIIDQVKQIIGKALEGGVLRKEDEVKYIKILPTIGDPVEVAKSKIASLVTTIQEKRQNTLDALDDANYDVSQFRARHADTSAPKEGDTKPIDGFPGTEQTYKNGKWIRTK